MAKIATVERVAGAKAEPDSRAQLLAATSEVLIERGSLDISLIDIARKSGLAPGLIGYYFGSKNGLFFALLTEVLGKSIDELAHLSRMALPARDKMRIHISGIVNTYFKYPYANSLIHYMVQEERGGWNLKVADKFTTPLAVAQASILAQGIDEGVFKAVSPMLFYYNIVGACDHLFFAKSLKTSFGIDRVTEEIKRDYIAHLNETTLAGLMRTTEVDS